MRVLQASLLLACTASSAHASDFWDEVRTPGLHAYRARVAAAAEALARGRPGAAVEHARAAAERIAARPEAHRLLGRVLTALGRHEEAVGAFERALRIDPAALDDPLAATDAATSAVAHGALPLAEHVLGRALARLGGARRDELLVWHGDVLQALGTDHLTRAMLSYREALGVSTDATRTRALLGLALALHRRGEPDEALALARQPPGGAEVERDLLRASPLPPIERVARKALRLTAIGDRAGALEAWGYVAGVEGPWRAHAAEAARALRVTR